MACTPDKICFCVHGIFIDRQIKGFDRFPVSAISCQTSAFCIPIFVTKVRRRSFSHNAYLGNAVLCRSNLTATNLRFSTWSSSDLSQIKLTASTIQQADFSHASLREIDFCNAQIFNTDFSGSELHDTDFADARLEKVNFNNTKLDPKYFKEAYLQNCTFD